MLNQVKKAEINWEQYELYSDADMPLAESRLDAMPVLEKVGLGPDVAKRNVLKLSGRQRQRVAIARALISDSSMLLADEPIGSLDEENAKAVTELLLKYAHENNGKCVIIVTHFPELAQKADVILKLEDGILKRMHRL